MSIQLQVGIIYAVLVLVVSGKRLSDLIFPKGSTFTVTVISSVFMPEEDAKGFAQVLELDFTYPLVEKAMGKKPPPKSVWINPIAHPEVEQWRSEWLRQNRMIKDRQRKDLRRQLENAINLFGFDGRGCIFRFQCELNKHITKPETLLEDLLLILFKRRNLDCSSSNSFCPFSLLQIILNSQYVNGTLH